MTTDELLEKLPRCIGNNGANGCFFIFEEDDQIGWLTLINEGGNPPWKAMYSDNLEGAVCMNPKEGPPYNNAIVYGDTAHEALQEMYNWCKENGFIKDE